MEFIVLYPLIRLLNPSVVVGQLQPYRGISPRVFYGRARRHLLLTSTPDTFVWRVSATCTSCVRVCCFIMPSVDMVKLIVLRVSLACVSTLSVFLCFAGSSSGKMKHAAVACISFVFLYVILRAP